MLLSCVLVIDYKVNEKNKTTSVVEIKLDGQIICIIMESPANTAVGLWLNYILVSKKAI